MLKGGGVWAVVLVEDVFVEDMVVRKEAIRDH
jgi:hypothetical protein